MQEKYGCEQWTCIFTYSCKWKKIALQNLHRRPKSQNDLYQQTQLINSHVR